MSNVSGPESAAAATPLTLTERALDKVRAFASQHPEAEGKRLRIYVQGGGRAAYEYGFTFDDHHDGDLIVAADDLEVLVDPYSVMYMWGSEVDFVEDVRGSGFVVDNPNLPALLQDPIAARLHEIIEQKINPGIASHGGWVSLIDYDEGRAYLQLGGGCQGCGMADVTLKQGIERIIRQEVPEVVEVLDTTDHASGTNPYYTASK